MFLPSKHLLSAFYKTLPSKNPSKNLVFTLKKPLQAPSKNPSKKHLLLENLLRTLLRSVRLHDPLGVHLVGTFWSKISIFPPNFIVKIGQEKPPQKMWGFSCFQVFSSFSAFFCLSFSSLPLLFDILKPKICPADEGSLAFASVLASLCLEHTQNLRPHRTRENLASKPLVGLALTTHTPLIKGVHLHPLN